MFRRKRIIFPLVFAFIISFVVSSAVCLDFLPSAALAADSSPAAPMSKPDATGGARHPVMAPAVREHCGSVGPVPTEQRTSQAAPMLAGSAAPDAVRDCCLSQDHHPSAASTDSLQSFQPLAALLSSAVQPRLSLFIQPSYRAEIFPPPEAAALLTIVKRE
ncbi:MAG: hypothetical protein WC453_03855 [Patescibacteria group bacterium]